MLGVSAAEAVFVGDTIDADVEGPKAVGYESDLYRTSIAEGIRKVLP